MAILYDVQRTTVEGSDEKIEAVSVRVSMSLGAQVQARSLVRLPSKSHNVIPSNAHNHLVDTANYSSYAPCKVMSVAV